MSDISSNTDFIFSITEASKKMGDFNIVYSRLRSALTANFNRRSRLP
jgi:hypothetical protein